MEGDGFDFFGHHLESPAGGLNLGSQRSGSGGAYDPYAGMHGVDLNAQTPFPAEKFPHLSEYDNLLRGVDAPAGGLHGATSSVPPLRVQRTLGVRTPRAPRRGGPVAAARGRGKHASTAAGSSSIGGPQSSSGGGGARGGSSAPSSGRFMSAARATGRRRARTRGGNAGGWQPAAPQGLSADFVDVEGQDEEDNGTNDYDSGGGQAVSPLRANWSDENNAILLGLCIEQLRAGHYADGTMSTQGYKNGLPPPNLNELEILFADTIVDGSTGFVPGQDFYEEEEMGEDETEEEEEPSGTPTTTSSRRSKRSLGTGTTCDSPVKKSKSPMVRYMKHILASFDEALNVNKNTMKQAVDEQIKARKEAEQFSVKRCQDLAFQCGISEDGDEVYAMGKMFESAYQRQFFCNLPTAKARLGYFKNWCRDNGYKSCQEPSYLLVVSRT